MRSFSITEETKAEKFAPFDVQNHKHQTYDIVGLDEALKQRIDIRMLGRRNGVAMLDCLGKISISQFPGNTFSTDFNPDFNGDFGGSPVSAGVGRPTFNFPMAPGLGVANIGDLVMNQNGVATLANPAIAQTGTLGVWALSAVTNVVPHEQATWQLTLNSVPVAGDIISIDVLSTTQYGFVFVTTLTGVSAPAVEVEIGVDITTSRNNLVTAMEATIPATSFQVSGLSTDKVVVVAGDNNIGSAGNNFSFSYTSGLFSALVTAEGADNMYMHANSILLYFRDSAGTTRTLQWAAVLSPYAPAGIVKNGYKYPLTTTELLGNIFWALSTSITFSAGFDLSLDTEVITLTQKNVFTSSHYEFYVNDYDTITELNVDGAINLQVVTEPVHYIPPYVKYPVLGVLAGIDAITMNAVIEGADFVPLKLSAETSIQFDPSNPISITPRLVVPGPNGKAILYKTFIDQFANEDKARISAGLPLYEVMEEAEAGAQVVGRRVSAMCCGGHLENSYYY